MKWRRHPLPPRHTPLKQAHVSKKLLAILLLFPMSRTQKPSLTCLWPKPLLLLIPLPRRRCQQRSPPPRPPNHWHQAQVCTLHLPAPALHSPYHPPLGLCTISASPYPQPYFLTVTLFFLNGTPHPQSLICKINPLPRKSTICRPFYHPEMNCDMPTLHPAPPNSPSLLTCLLPPQDPPPFLPPKIPRPPPPLLLVLTTQHKGPVTLGSPRSMQTPTNVTKISSPCRLSHPSLVIQPPHSFHPAFPRTSIHSHP